MLAKSNSPPLVTSHLPSCEKSAEKTTPECPSEFVRDADRFEVAHIPEGNRGIRTRGGEALAIGREGETQNRGRPLRQNLQRFRLRDFPEYDLSLIGADSQY